MGFGETWKKDSPKLVRGRANALDLVEPRFLEQNAPAGRSPVCRHGLRRRRIWLRSNRLDAIRRDRHEHRDVAVGADLFVCDLAQRSRSHSPRGNFTIT